ncbi:glycoside hydrolase family 13 protein [Lasiosphaeria miniovina]|uniref:alpha-amylase n=1 Tax=Lasiosphaeria miniovina TaxID=1954250 RepID=A0AA39ZUC1_9PEZI|nr:glycoside hydrolase family 13 protein [Lasiosphaeria miniovina]KAK0703832.1 glycoside hydrolase family 13 protein [Lasiosphaeria miniovina]
MRITSLHLGVLAAVVSWAPQVGGMAAAGWRGQSIYQVVTDRFARTDLSTTAACNASQQVYCGGTWRGLISRLDYIQGMGFTAIWISPVVKQMDGNTADGSSYHGYWAQDIMALNSAFGTPTDLAALAAALHVRGMALMVDVVTNHMAYKGCGSCVNYSIFTPFSSASYFHPFCFIDYSNQTSVEVCWQGTNTVSLPDLRTESDDVRLVWNNWIAGLVSTYSIDGLRIDSVKHVEQSFWSGFMAAAGVYAVGEVFSGDPAYTAPYQKYIDGVLDYPSYYWITRAFQSPAGSISSLVDGLNTLTQAALDPSLYGSFIENHDVPRFPSLTGDVALVKNAIAFTMLKDGIPIVYQGQEQHYSGGATPANREALWLSGYSTSSELYRWISQLNQIRTWAISQDAGYLTYKARPIYSDGHTIAMRKGLPGYQVVAVFTNIGSASSSTVALPSSVTGFNATQSLIDVMSCTTVVADSSGGLALALTGGLPKVLYPLARLSGSGVCPSTVPGTTSSSETPTTTSPTTSTLRSLSIAITFNELVTTTFGDTIKITGNVASLGNWNPSNGVALNASKYTTSNPLWFGTVSIAPGSVVAYKFVKVSSSGAVAWEADPNHTATIPCTAATLSSSWQA